MISANPRVIGGSKAASILGGRLKTLGVAYCRILTK